jgi:hypothetical protein
MIAYIKKKPIRIATAIREIKVWYFST